VSRLPRDAVLDTTWHGLGPGLAGCRIVNRKHAWAINDNWFTIEGHPERFYRPSELLELSRAGAVRDSTMLNSVHYRFMVRAATDSAARAVAKAKLPARPPRAVRKELERLEREYQEKLKAQGP
jgi:alkanesulfonate monooxygenase SsuD/methylene tetrahydromethanopterin reductase-like flavin-dependent oxidoreductase (luciferase family)